MDRRAFLTTSLAGTTGIATILTGCLAPLFVTDVMAVNKTNHLIRPYVAVTEVALFDVKSKEWNLHLVADETQKLSFGTGDSNPRQIIVELNGQVEKLEVNSTDISDIWMVRITFHDQKIEFTTLNQR